MLRSILRAEISVNINSTHAKTQLVFWNQTIFWSPGADDQRGHISVSCEQAARAIGRSTIVVLFLLD